MTTLNRATVQMAPGSFRDPAGFVFKDGDVYKRAITRLGEDDYRLLMSSGLYDELVRDGLLVGHTEEPTGVSDENIRVVLTPEQITHISYFYEWSFGQLRDAALLTLELQRRAMRHGMSLKDASAFNVQFRGPMPVFIDTSSFERNDGGPWQAYGQFCRHFVAPLLLMSQVAPAFNHALVAYPDGFPLDLTSQLLPASTYLKGGVLLHVHLHARSQARYSGTRGPVAEAASSSSKRDPKPGFIDSLQSLIQSIKPGRFRTEWMDYYDNADHYTDAADAAKRDFVSRSIDSVSPRLMYDLGGNTGVYSRLATKRGIDVVCYDIDPVCVHRNYERARRDNDRHMLPLMIDLSNPTPALGFDHAERSSFAERCSADLLLALAILHHLRVTANVPFENIARFMAGLGRRLVIEWVPKDDEMTQILLRSRKDTFMDYTQADFLKAFERHFVVEDSLSVPETKRVLYLLRSKA